MQDAAFNHHFAALYKKLLPDLEHHHARKFLITFCGVPSSGKTTLAKRLSADLSAHRVSNDEIRDMLQSQGQSLEGITIGKISGRAIEDILKESQNKVVIADSSIDRLWPAFFETAERAEVPTFVIRMNCSKEEIERRLKLRGRSDSYIGRHEVFFEQFETCRQHVVADLELEPDYDYDAVLAAIKVRLASAK